MSTLIEDAAMRRRGEVAQRSHRPSERRSAPERGSAPCTRGVLALRSATTVQRNGMTAAPVGGHASTTEHGYEMYDMFGPYTEVVTAGAFGRTLAASPMVEFTRNHGAGGTMPMAHTRNDTLDLAEDDTGLAYDAYTDPQRSDVADMLLALERGDLAEASFKFRIDSGIWSPDYTEYRIDQVDINRGDVSAVNFGANPAATSGVRSLAVPDRVRRIIRRDLVGLAGRAQARALSPADVGVLSELLSALAAADAALDPIAAAIGQADMTYDCALVTLSQLLGVANPDFDAEDDDADEMPPAGTQAATMPANLQARFAAAAAGAERPRR